MEKCPKAHTCVSLWERRMKEGRPGRQVSREYDHLLVQDRGEVHSRNEIRKTTSTRDHNVYSKY